MQIEDKRCRKLVNFFNSIDLKTKFCCQGHTIRDCFWIMFEDEIKDESIVNFLYKIEKNGESFGEFNKWIRLHKDPYGPTKVLLNWVYSINPVMIKLAKDNEIIAEEHDFKLFSKSYGVLKCVMESTMT